MAHHLSQCLQLGIEHDQSWRNSKPDYGRTLIIMTRCSVILIFLLIPEVFAQVSFPTRVAAIIQNPRNVIDFQNASIEVFPQRRVSVESAEVGKQVIRESVSSATASLADLDGVLVFNYAYQAYGYATGQISFKFKTGRAPTMPLPEATFSGFRKLGNLDVYEVNAKNPAEFLDLYRLIQARTDVEWVVPDIRYAPKE